MKTFPRIDSPPSNKLGKQSNFKIISEVNCGSQKEIEWGGYLYEFATACMALVA